MGIFLITWKSFRKYLIFQNVRKIFLIFFNEIKMKTEPAEYFRQARRKQGSKFWESHVLQLRHLPQFDINFTDTFCLNSL